MKVFTKFLMALALSIPVSIASPATAADWKDSECRKDKDESGSPVEVCRSGSSIGIFWSDGSLVNGWCDSREYDIDYKGVTEKEAVSWVEYYCGKY